MMKIHLEMCTYTFYNLSGFKLVCLGILHPLLTVKVIEMTQLFDKPGVISTGPAPIFNSW